MTREAWIVVDLGFGDAGKGTLTDHLVRARGASLVVRYNGGAQAGHNVVTDDGRHHTFSQFGSGHLAGAATLLGPDVIVHPLGMAVEAEHLASVGPDPWPRTWVDPRCRVITPYQQAANRAREAARGDTAHGTCGVGVGECAADHLDHPDDGLRVADLAAPARVRARLTRQRDRKRAELEAIGADLSLFDDRGLIDRVVETWSAVAARLQLARDSRAQIAAADVVVLEGAQGVLLDEAWGFHPHTTWSDTTAAGAHRLLGDRPAVRLGVLRAYAVRHGAGPFPTAGTLAVPEVHNTDDGPQGRFRTGALDGVLLRYAAEVCGGVDALAVTCLDRVTTPLGCDRYDGPAPPGLAVADARGVARLTPGPRDALEHRERLGQWLRGVAPQIAPRDPLALAEEATGAPVWITSRGPRSRDKAWSREPPRRGDHSFWL